MNEMRDTALPDNPIPDIPGPTTDARKPASHPILRKLFRMILAIVLGFALVVCTALYLCQDSIIFHPQPYAISFTRMQQALKKTQKFLIFDVPYTTAEGRQVAYYIPPSAGPEKSPARFWVVFGGNASLALDWLDVLEQPLEKRLDPQAGFLLVDYPSFGTCEGRPSPRAILQSSEQAMAALARQLKADPQALYRHLYIAGWSLGSCAALQLAARQPAVERIVLISPFTSLLDMARLNFGWPLCYLLKHRFDNRARLAELARRPHRPAISITHGSADSIVPVTMGRELAGLYPGWIHYREIPNADHFITELLGPEIRAAATPSNHAEAAADK